MSAPPLRPLSAGEILDLAFRLYARLFVPLVAVQVICSGLPFLLNVYVVSLGPGARSGALAAVGYLLAFVLGSLAAAASAYVVSESYLGREIGAGAALARAAPRTGRVAVLSLLTGLVTGAAAVPFFVTASTGLYALGRGDAPGLGSILVLAALGLLALPVLVFSSLAVGTPCLVLEDLPSATRALGRTWRLTAGARLRIAGLLFVFLLLAAVPLAALSVLGGLVAEALGGPGPAGARGAELGASVLGALLGFVLTPAAYCVLTLVYYDLRVRREGFDLELLAASLEPA